MQRIAIEFTYHVDIIIVPDDIAAAIEKYQEFFDEWLYDKNNEHGHWILYGGQKFAVSFDTNSFVEYLNLNHLQSRKEKASIEQESVLSLSDDIPRIFF